MLINTPSSTSFRELAIDFSNLAIDSSFEILEYLDEVVEEYSFNADGTLLAMGDNKFGKADRTYVDRAIRTTTTLSQQSAEFFIKSRLVEVSPFSILAEPPDKWKAGNSGDVDYEDLKTLDAALLPNAYNKLCTPPLCNAFLQSYEKTRRLRNRVVHGVSRKLLTPSDLLLFILQTHFTFDVDYVPERLMHYRYGDPEIYQEAAHLSVAKEFRFFIEHLGASTLLQFLSIDKRNGGRFYSCPTCINRVHRKALRYYEVFPRVAQLKSKNLLKCPICRRESRVKRANCSKVGCKGDAISSAGQCLTCGSHG